MTIQGENGSLYSMKVVHLGEEVLRRQALPVDTVTPELQNLIREMFITMDAEQGIGLAAPQIGESLRLFVIKIDDNVERVFINPQIISTSPETGPYEEGCLSIPGVYEDVIRPLRITVQAINERGRRFTLEAEDLLARVIQHEYDHLEGVLFIDRLSPAKKQKAEAKFRVTEKVSGE